MSTTPDERGAYDRRGAASYLSTRKLDDLAAPETIKLAHCGRKGRYRKSDLDAYLVRLAEEVV